MRKINAAARREIARLDEIASRPMPQSIREVIRARPYFDVPTGVSPFPLRCADGRTWAERKAQENAA